MRARMLVRFVLTVASALAAALAVVLSASAATFTVNSSVDGPDAFTGDTTCADILNRCTLRAAIEQANAQGGPDQVNLPPGTYELGPIGELTVSSNIAIDGTGNASNTAIAQTPPGRVIEVTSAAALDLRDATVRNGVLADLGGGIRADGSLTLRRAVLTGNEAFGVTGGGLYAHGNTVIVDSAIRGNRAAHGAGIGYGGPPGGLTIARSTLNNNTATSTFGGGLYTAPGGEATITNSTVSGNSAGTGGGMALFADTTLEHVTVAGNIGAVAGIDAGQPNTITLAATILDNPSGDNCSAFSTYASAGGNVEDGNDCGFDGPGDQPNTDPLLGALQNNGGPTQTRAIAFNSPARDAVTSGCPPPVTDQRGVARPQGPRCDSGAFEIVPPPADGSPPPSEVSNDFSFGKVKRNKKKGTAKLTVNVPGPGELDLAKTKKVKPDEELAEAAGKEKLRVKPKGKAKKKLNRKGRAKVKANVTYTPDGGEPNTQGKKIKLVKR